ncbi:hypothetical protein [Streptomyces sp. NPDC001389]|uniref:hypothetical protein n=1 Tax=unclassified Streptomyces TaxID=2593676 RepID=UPI0036AD25B0
MSARSERSGARPGWRRGNSGTTVRLVAATAIGALTGLAVFSLTEVTGRILFVVTGGIAGALTVLVLHWYQRTARLTEVKVTIPQLSELTFAVNNDARQVAWQMFVETVTRVSTQPLASDQGVLREALTSLYGLFATTRETLKTSRPSAPVPGGQTVESLAITMLNRELRPFLSQWHPRLREFELAHPGGPESSWEQSAACRAELQRVQSELHSYAVGFARLAGVRDAESLIRPVPGPRIPSDPPEGVGGPATGSAREAR